MATQHRYQTNIEWEGNLGPGTLSYTGYSRNYSIQSPGKLSIPASSDPAFRGDAARYNPEELLVASLSSCHMLWYLHLCASHGIVVLAYTDEAIGTMQENEKGGHFTKLCLHPRVRVQQAAMIEKAIALHSLANEYCFIANSVNFEVTHLPQVFV